MAFDLTASPIDNQFILQENNTFIDYSTIYFCVLIINLISNVYLSL